MANTIPTVSIPAAVIQFNNTQFIVDGQPSPQIINVPCRNAELDHVEYWFVPVKDDGVFTVYTPVPKEGDFITQPTPDSFSVFRVREQLTPYYTYWVVGTISDYYASCQTCCGDAFVPMPCTTDSPAECPPPVVPCSIICDAVDSEGNFISVFGIPTLGAGQSFIGYAIFNGEELSDVSGADVTTLLADINATWGTIGSPSETIIWTKSADGLTLIGTGFEIENEICVAIIAVD